MQLDRKSTRLNSSHTVIYTLSLHDALPISLTSCTDPNRIVFFSGSNFDPSLAAQGINCTDADAIRSEEHTSELQSHRDLHSFPTRRSSDLADELHRPEPHCVFLGFELRSFIGRARHQLHRRGCN